MPNSDGDPLSLQRYLKEYDLVLQSTQQMVGYSGNPGDTRVTGMEGDADTEIIPVDAAAARTEVINVAALQAALLLKYFSWESRISIALPNVLTAVNVVWNIQSGSGEDSHPISQQQSEYAGTALLTVSYNVRSSAQASISVIPDVQPKITYYSESGRNILVTNYVFYAIGHLTEADIITRLTAIIGGSPSLNFLPVFLPVSEVITCKGQQASIKQEADSSATLTGNADNIAFSRQWGNGNSTDTGVSIHTTILPPTVHGGITLTNASYDPPDVSVSVDASTLALYHNADVIVDPITNTPTPIDLSIDPGVYPTTLDPTGGGTVPTSGLYIVDTNVQLADYGMLLVHASVADMAQL